jgi:hypothetical protein
MRRSTVFVLVTLVLGFVARTAGAQQADPLVTPPPNVILPNANGVPVGPFGGLEGGAYVARVDDPSATWFNPAGLSRAKTTQISGSAGLYQFISVAPTSLPNQGGGLQQVPNLVGFSLSVTSRCTAGFALVTANSWEQETDSQVLIGSAASGERFGYSADSEFSRRDVNFSAGCERGRMRYGAGLTIALTNLRLVDTVSDRISNATGLRTLLLSTRKTGSTQLIRPIFGMQFDASEKWHAGVVVRTPAATLHRSGVYATDGTLQGGGASEGVSLFDDSATFTYKLPWEIQGGIGYVGKRVQAEFDVQGMTSISPYALLATSNPIIVYSDGGQGAPPSITTQPFNGLTSASRGIANVTAGGHYQLSASHSYLLHFGFTTDQSPVAQEDRVFDQVNLYGWTLGLSGKLAKLQFAAGFNMRRGTSDDILVRDLLSGQPVSTTIKIRTAALIYSLSYAF